MCLDGVQGCYAARWGAAMLAIGVLADRWKNNFIFRVITINQFND